MRSTVGPAFVAAIAYVDPGNVASNVSAGARFGYLLVWVVVTANAMAGLVQFLSAKLGIVAGISLPEAVRARTCRPVRLLYWGQAEIVAVATDLAEVVGGAIALNLLFGLPLVVGGVITGVVSMALLVFQDRGERWFERAIIGLLAVVAVGFVVSAVVARPAPQEAAAGLVPAFAGADSVVLAAAMLGATVMPHAVYLHSGLVRDRFGPVRSGDHRRLLWGTRIDVTSSMFIAGVVNMSMLLLAASALQGSGGDVESISGAHAAVTNALGGGVGLLFAIGLLASGFASSSVGAYAGAMIMDGLLQRRVPLVLRRMITLVPAVAVLAAGVDPSRALIVSQVVLSFGIPFALIPLVRFTSDATLMGQWVNRRGVTGVAMLVVAVIVVLNIVLIYLTVA
ncbi:MAG: divalent metal cation transporter [Gordonia sp.]|jgi:manganese transport protein|nr:Nramp family divalent metal transporter [Gordonia sp. (in: high G+C Gram-positive bacteria)]MAU83726.1 divalent metal cation transporter [Gordonia sp. (in: high G+C Gram-positive bacteria)]